MLMYTIGFTNGIDSSTLTGDVIPMASSNIQDYLFYGDDGSPPDKIVKKKLQLDKKKTLSVAGKKSKIENDNKKNYSKAKLDHNSTNLRHTYGDAVRQFRYSLKIIETLFGYNNSKTKAVQMNFYEHEIYDVANKSQKPLTTIQEEALLCLIYI